MHKTSLHHNFVSAAQQKEHIHAQHAHAQHAHAQHATKFACNNIMQHYGFHQKINI